MYLNEIMEIMKQLIYMLIKYKIDRYSTDRCHANILYPLRYMYCNQMKLKNELYIRLASQNRDCKNF